MSYYIKQIGTKDCAFACLKMMLAIIYRTKKFLFYPQEDKDKCYSLEDIIKIANKEGVELTAFRYKCKENIFSNDVTPLLIPIKTKNILHMVLIKRIKGNKIQVYDPDLGIYWIEEDELMEIWNGECLEPKKIKKSYYNEPKKRIIPIKFRIGISIFQLSAFASLLSCLFFVNKDYHFTIPLCLFLIFAICEFTYKCLVIAEMKYFDKKILDKIVCENKSEFQKRYCEMSKFKEITLGNPIQIINSIVILLVGTIILALNGYLNIVNLLIIFAFAGLGSFLEFKLYGNKNNLENKEKALLNENIFGIETYKEKILNFQNSVYGFVSFINARKYVIAFLAAVLSAIYAAFANQISINFILFHTFFYLYLSDSLTKIFEVIIKKPEFDYYKCLYQYYSRDY